MNKLNDYFLNEKIDKKSNEKYPNNNEHLEEINYQKEKRKNEILKEKLGLNDSSSSLIR